MQFKTFPTTRQSRNKTLHRKLIFNTKIMRRGETRQTMNIRRYIADEFCKVITKQMN